MKKVLILLGVMALLVSCSPKKDAVKRFEKFAKELREDSDNWSDVEWDEAYLKYNDLKEELLVYPLSTEEIMHLDSLHVECLTILLMRGSNK